MCTFLDEPAFRLHPNPKSRWVMLIEPLRVEIEDGTQLTALAGFWCDLASLPKITRSFASDWRQTAKAGIIHDLIYRWAHVMNFERQEADDLYRRMLVACGVSGWRARVQYYALRAGAGGAWQRWRRMPDDIKGVRPEIPAELP